MWLKPDTAAWYPSTLFHVVYISQNRVPKLGLVGPIQMLSIKYSQHAENCMSLMDYRIEINDRMITAQYDSTHSGIHGYM